MKIDGKALADAILSTLTQEVLRLKEKGTTPTLAVILVGDDPESLAYIRQKQKMTEKIGGRFIFEQLPKTTTPKELAARIAMYNADNAVHGLIVQRPVPIVGDTEKILNTVAPKKDVDGFIPNSPYDVPIAHAVLDILDSIYADYANKKIVIIGRGETAGKPIAAAFAKRHCATFIINSTTPHPKEIMRSSDILISCVGRERVVTPDAVKSGAILLSVGLWRGDDGHLHGDYDEEEIKTIASFYTPTPGGMGPLNIASLMQNLVKAAAH